MGTWGTGIKQNDDFLDVYDEFFEKYVGDADPHEIASGIWQDYYTDFGSDIHDPILHTVRFALAQSLWECGIKDEKLWSEIEDIIANDKDLVFWKELEANEKQLKSRKKQLELFWQKINSVPKRIRKPKKHTEPRKPTLEKGDVFAYSVGEGYRAFVVFDYVWNSFLVAVTDTVLSTIPQASDVWNSKTSLVFWATQRAVIPKKDRILIEHVKIDGNYNGRAGLIDTEWLVGCDSIGERIWFFEPEKAKVSMERNHIDTYVMKKLLNPKALPFDWYAKKHHSWIERKILKQK